MAARLVRSPPASAKRARRHLAKPPNSYTDDVLFEPDAYHGPSRRAPLSPRIRLDLTIFVLREEPSDGSHPKETCTDFSSQ